jgi:predicted transposase/invertase (TIGR01784 family)
MRTITLEEYSKQLAKEEGIMLGIEKGIEKGLVQGIEKGLEQGIEKGRFEVARSMISEGLPLEIIKKCTGLDEDDILALG